MPMPHPTPWPQVSPSALRPAFLILLMALLGAIGCGSGGPAKVDYPLWQGPDQRAFSDDIEPLAAGLSLEERTPPRADGMLRQRAQTADVIARFRVETVTVDAVGDKATYHLWVEPLPPVIRAEKDPPARYELTIRPGTPAHGIAKALDTRMQGMMFLGFLKRFQDEWAEPSLHFFLASDDEEVMAAVREAIALGEVSGE